MGVLASSDVVPQRSRRVLIVTAHFPPDRSAGTHRLLRFSNDLTRLGWEPIVLTIDPSHYRASVPLDDNLTRRVNGSVSVTRTKVVRGLTQLLRIRNSVRGNGGDRPERKGTSTAAPSAPALSKRVSRAAAGLFTFPDAEIGWLPHAVMAGRRIAREAPVDAVLTSGPPFSCHLIGNALKRILGVPWVADFRDPWARAPWGRVGNARAHQFLERQTVRTADAVVLNTPELHDEFANCYGVAAARRFHCISNGFDRELLEPFRRLQPPVNGPLVMTHAGTLYKKRNPAPLLEALADRIRAGTISRDALRVQFVGQIKEQCDPSGLVERLGIRDLVVQVPPQPHDVCLTMLAQSHVLLVIQPETELQVPGKIYEYIGLERPILALAERGAVSRVIEQSEAGTVVSPFDTGAIGMALEQLCARGGSARAFIPHESAVRRFDAFEQSRRLASVLEMIVSQ